MLPIVKRSSVFPRLFNDLVSASYSDYFGDKTFMNIPAVNVTENDKEYEIELAAPGLSKADFQIKVVKNVLEISSEKQIKKEEDKDSIVRKEFGYSSFKRSFILPEDVHHEGIKASYSDGVLTVSVPKKEEEKEPAPKKIDIQ